jgi:hypothetical protein
MIRKPPTTTGTVAATPENKRFTKLSQKERKRLSMMGQSVKPVDEKEMTPEGNFRPIRHVYSFFFLDWQIFSCPLN